ncbi:hypothetical protein [Okeania sp. SIO2B3]|uniref:hypothetical protein n=1 Tax=Okeania sp. SIO2B3 TaxID=2607784 RepID=UPI0013C1A974|nr:hypothetical protein [Okeania sp. SIO2B3]NET42376.1 hypothetical protein [Okeania sp. SIO2B3]
MIRLIVTTIILPFAPCTSFVGNMLSLELLEDRAVGASCSRAKYFFRYLKSAV